MMLVTINGITDSADHTVNALAKVLETDFGIKSVHLTYPTRSWRETRSRRSQYLDAKRMLRQLPKGGCNVLAHSWGGLLGCRMMELGGTDVFNKGFYFAPAIDKDWVFPDFAFKQLFVIHNEQDRALWAAEHLFGSEHPWGDMGKYGYFGEDSRIISVRDTTKRSTPFERMHSHYFTPAHVKVWASFVNTMIQES